MGTYKGNVGNLMQHWTLCEVLLSAQRRGITGLNYIDAHAMAPLAEPEDPAQIDDIFASVQCNLPGQNSAYEQAWHHLVPRGLREYPSSAAFVQQIWNGQFSLTLCEIVDTIADEIRDGLPEAKVFQGDWRKRFEQGLLKPGHVGLRDDSLTLVSFDPHSCSRELRADRHNPHREIIYLKDLMLTQRILHGVKGPVIIQLSTYSEGRGQNPQGAVISSVNSVLFRGGYVLATVVIPTGVNGVPRRDMMSLVYARGVDWADKLAVLPDNFADWLGEVRRQMRQQV